MANEKRLIDADALRCEIDGCSFESGYDAGKVLIMIAEAPTVDAVEVVHARWEDEYGGAFANPRYRCSACKEKALYRHERDCLGGWHEVQALTDYCPNCGAKMDGDTE